jgi:tRNA(Arg) A34 adenosine deaminase TadA
MQDRHNHFMQQALTLAGRGVDLGHGGPFGALVVVDDRVIGEGWNQVVERNDPTAHAEILAIRAACESVGQFHLPQATLYTSCEPCPMCLGAAYWAHIDHLVYAATAEDAAAFGFDDQQIRQAIQLPLQQQKMVTQQRLREKSLGLFRAWQQSAKRIDY